MDGIMKRTILRAPFFLYLAGFALTGLSGLALAQKVTWEFHKSLTGAFDVRFPSKYKIKSIPLRIDNKTVLFRSEIVASVGEGPEGKENQKVFLVKVDQSMANRLKGKEIKKLLDVDAFRYKKSAQRAGGVVLSNDAIDMDGFKGREMYITYGDGDDKQALRVKIMYTDISRVEMVLTGPASSMYAFKSNDFFDSLKLYDGPGKIDGQPGENWQDYESPLGLFTLRLPPEGNSYTLGPPKFVHERKKERGRFVFIDPILSYKSFFNFYGYKVDEKMNFDKVKTLLLSAHVAPYADKVRLEDLKIDTKTSEDGSYGTVTTLLRMRPLEKYPYINAVLLQAYFNDEGVVVLEYLGANSFVEMPLGKTLFSLVKFHPEKYSDERASKAGSSGDGQSLEDDEDSPAEDGESVDVVPDDEDEEESSQSEDATTLKANIKLGEGADADAKAPEATPEGAKPPAEAATDTAPKSPAPAVTPAAGQAPAPEAPKPEAAAPPVAVKAAAPPKAPAPAQAPAATASAAPQTPAAVQPTAPVQPAAPAKAP